MPDVVITSSPSCDGGLQRRAARACRRRWGRMSRKYIADRDQEEDAELEERRRRRRRDSSSAGEEAARYIGCMRHVVDRRAYGRRGGLRDSRPATSTRRGHQPRRRAPRAAAASNVPAAMAARIRAISCERPGQVVQADAAATPSARRPGTGGAGSPGCGGRTPSQRQRGVDRARRSARGAAFLTLEPAGAGEGGAVAAEAGLHHAVELVDAEGRRPRPATPGRRRPSGSAGGRRAAASSAAASAGSISSRVSPTDSPPMP